jgi:pimeloyl-ACP methyl ester carboxylesterase
MSLGELPHLAAGQGPETVLLLADDMELVPSLAQQFRVLAPKQPPTEAEDLEDFLLLRAQAGDAPVHVVAEAAAAQTACWLAIRAPERVQRLVLARPACLSDDLVRRLGEIQAETLVVLDSAAPAEAGHEYQQRLPRAYRFFLYSPARLGSLIADFLVRGERFIVNTGEATSWSK